MSKTIEEISITKIPTKTDLDKENFPVLFVAKVLTEKTIRKFGADFSDLTRELQRFIKIIKKK